MCSSSVKAQGQSQGHVTSAVVYFFEENNPMKIYFSNTNCLIFRAEMCICKLMYV